MPNQLSREQLQPLIEAEEISKVQFADLCRWFTDDTGISGNQPDGICQVDPRNGDRILYNSARAKRPHDNVPTEAAGGSDKKACVICEGRTTKVVDVAPLSEGFTFINKNLFPMVYPVGGRAEGDGIQLALSPKGRGSQGMHFLQWTSSLHDRDWHNMPADDQLVAMERLAALEERLLATSGSSMPSASGWGGEAAHSGYVVVVKNFGRLVGGSLAHGHQQIVLSDIAPRRFVENQRYQREHGHTFSEHLLGDNPPTLTLRDYGSAVLLVPYFMKRPAEMMLVVKDSSRRYLHELSTEEKRAVAQGWGDGTRAIREIMPRWGRETAYNVVTHNGPGAGLYFEFLPYTQETGSYEHLGLFVCQGTPQNAHEQLLTVL